MRLARDCKGYEDFKEEMKLLRKYRTNYGKVSLIANHWMREICNINKAEIMKLVNNYEKGIYDPFKFEIESEYSEEDNEDDLER